MSNNQGKISINVSLRAACNVVRTKTITPQQETINTVIIQFVYPSFVLDLL